MQSLQPLLFPLIVIAIFYFLFLRPQNKRQKERSKMLGALKKGDKIITIGGLHGTIVDLNENRVTLKVGDNTRLVFERSAVNEKLSADADKPVKEEKPAKEEKNEVNEEKDKKEEAKS